jgi:hypothetical protein
MSESKEQLIRKLLFHLFDEFGYDPNMLDHMYRTGFYNNLAYEDIWEKINHISGEVVYD